MTPLATRLEAERALWAAELRRLLAYEGRDPARGPMSRLAIARRVELLNDLVRYVQVADALADVLADETGKTR